MTQPHRSVQILGVRFDDLTRREAAEAIVNLANSGEKSYVVKPYSEFMPRAHRDPKVREVLNGAALVLADGVGILWAGRLLGRRLREAMHGVDFTWEMLSAVADAGFSVYLLGGTAEEVEGAAERIGERLPALRILGARNGYFRVRGAENEAVVEAINTASPDILLVGMGFPRQEQWIARNLPRLNVKVAVAEGGSFTFISGATRRAPRLVRRAGMEWLWRLVRQPWRLRRQMALPAFAWLVLRERLRRHRS